MKQNDRISSGKNREKIETKIVCTDKELVREQLLFMAGVGAEERCFLTFKKSYPTTF